MAVNQGLSQIRSNPPGSQGGNRSRINTVEITACRQDLGHSASRSAAGPGRDEASVQGMEEIANLVGALAEIGHHLLAHELEGAHDRDQGGITPPLAVPYDG